MLGGVSDIDDVVQEISLRLYRGICKLQDPSVFSVWLYRIIRNYCYSRHRLIGRKPTELSIDEYIENDASDANNELIERRVEFLPSEYMEDKFMSEAVLRVIEKQSKRAQQLLIMYYFDGMSNKEIAIALDMKISSITGRLAKLRTKMRGDMEKEMIQYDAYDIEGSGEGDRPVRTVIGNALATNAAILFPAAKLDVVTGAFHGTITANSVAGGIAGSGALQGAAGGAAQAAGHAVSIITGKVVIIVAAGVIGVSGVGFIASGAGGAWIDRVFSKGGGAAAEAVPAVSQEDWRKSKIVFETKNGENGHDDPIAAKLAFTVSINGYKSCSYVIENEKGAVIASGEGLEASAPFAALIGGRAYGTYTIRFDFTPASGRRMSLERDFIITDNSAAD
jgi:RNA polymerase sigma-70 factor (ECF subfamily)